jgi:hypothetical protein
VAQAPWPHDPFVHAAAAFATVGQAILHWPQFMGSPATFVSHPLPINPSQSAQPASHAPRPQTPAVHAPALECGCTGHVLPQAPQFIGSVAKLASHPLAAKLSQSPYPIVQPVKTHVLDAQPTVAFCAGVHAFLHAPQFLGSDVVSISQPSTACMLQSACPVSHDAIAHFPMTHDAAAEGRLQTLEQAPQ